MTAYTAFMIGFGIGVAWLAALIICAAWLYKALNDKSEYDEETGTEAVSFQG